MSFYRLNTLEASLGLSVIVKSPSAAAKAFGLGAQSSFYSEMRAGGATVPEALTFSVPAGVAEGVLEQIGLHVMIENMAVRSMGGAVIRNMLSEGIQESSQQAAGNFMRWAANRYSGATIEEKDGWKDLIYDSVYAGVLGSMTAFPVSVAGSSATRRVSQKTAEAFENAGMEAAQAQSFAGFLAYNDRVGIMAHALDEARATGNFDRALAVFTEQAGIVEDKTGRKFWSTLDKDEQESFIRSLVVPPEKFVSDAVQIANDMTDPDTFDDATAEGMAESFAEGLENYQSETDSRLDAAYDEQAEALRRAEQKSAQQRKILAGRTDLSETDKEIVGDLLSAFNASVADKFGAENLQELEVRGQETFDLSEATQEQVDDFNERAGIYEYENGLTREAAQMKAYEEVFGAFAKQAADFAESYDEIPFFQNAYDEYVRDFEFDDTGFMRDLAKTKTAVYGRKLSKKERSALRQKYNVTTEEILAAEDYLDRLRSRRFRRKDMPRHVTPQEKLSVRRREFEENEKKQKGLKEASLSLSTDVLNAMSDVEREMYANDYMRADLRERRGITASANLEYFTKRVLPEMQKSGEVKRVKKSDISGSLYIDGARVSDHSLPGKYGGDDGVILSGKLTGEEMRDLVLQEIDDAKTRKEERKQREPVFYQTAQEDLTERAGGPKIAADSETVDVVEIPKADIPDFEKKTQLRKWLVEEFSKIDDATIISTRQKVVFDEHSARRAIKNARNTTNNLAYPKIRDVVEKALYSGFRPADERHPNVEGQDVYHSAIIVDGNPYSVEFYVDVPKYASGKSRFAGNKVSRIKIAPADTQVTFDIQSGPTQSYGAIHTISMGVLRGKVNPARFKNGVLYQSAPTVRGAYYPENRVIELMKNADPSTIVHELGHHFTIQYMNLLQENGRETEAEGILKWMGAKSVQDVTTEQWEKLADAFVVYVKEGFAPSSKLENLFDSLKKYLTTLYEKMVVAAGRLPEITDDVRAFFDTMLSVDDKTHADFKQMLKQTRDLKEIVQGAIRGEALEINGLSVEDVKSLVRTLHTRMPRTPKTLEQKIRAAGGIDINVARALDLLPLMGAADDRFGKNGLFRKDGKLADEASIVEFLKAEGFLQDTDTAEAFSEQWRQAEEFLKNASAAYSPADTETMKARENINAAVSVAAETLAGIDYEALLEGLSSLHSVGAVGASKDVLKYIDAQLKRIQSDAKRLSSKLVKEARFDAARTIRREMKQKAKEDRDTLKERQKEIITFIRSYPLENKNGLISSVQKAFTAKKLSDILAEVKTKAESYYETEKRRRLKNKIETIVKKTRPSSIKNQKFDYERNVLFEKIREISKYTRDKAAKELERLTSSANEGEELNERDLTLRKYLTFKAKGMKASSALMESLLSDLEDAITEGREAKEESDFEKRKTLAIQKNAVRQAIVKRSQKAGADLWLRVSFICYFRPQSRTKDGCGFMRKKRFVYAPEWISGSLK